MNPNDEPTGWAAIKDGKISLRTASYRAEAAMINAICLWGGVDARATGSWSDEFIRQNWDRMVALAAEREPPVMLGIVEVICLLDQPIAYLRPMEGEEEGSLHACHSGDPRSFPVYAQGAE